MARIRSPGYPSFSLEQVVDFVGKVFAQDRQHPIDRESAARHMGFSGLSGTSDRALSAAMHFGLMEKVQKGEMRVTASALRILHPDTPAEKRQALAAAGFAPDLFKELRERYSGEPPSKDTLSSYLLRNGFASIAIPTATKAYLETCYYLQRTGAYESGLDQEDEAPEPPSPPVEDIPVPPVAQAAPVAYAPPPSPPIDPRTRPATSGRELVLNEPYLAFRGSREVHVEGILDLNGIIELEQKLKAVKMLLSPPIASAPQEPSNDQNDGGDGQDQ